ncbi:MAG: hypothetical protein J07HN4v3_00521 [Halonotius sp. J07HN4]|nr:MAG: hypothetical protein J07HN4v3_00521 [Halonotius sp. J07HN4]
MSDPQSTNRMDLLFNAIGIALVGLSVVVLAAILYLSVGLAGVDSLDPAIVGTVVFTAFVGGVVWLTKRVTDRSTARAS